MFCGFDIRLKYFNFVNFFLFDLISYFDKWLIELEVEYCRRNDGEELGYC